MTTMMARAGTYLRWALLGLLCFVATFPLYWMVRSAFGGGLFDLPPRVIPAELDMTSLTRIFQTQPVATWLGNSMIVAVATVLLGLAVSINAAYSLSRYRTILNQGISYMILITQMLPGAVLILPIYVIFLRLGLVNELLGLVIANVLFALPLSVWMLKGFFDAAPISLEEAAMVDGATRMSAFYRVTLPVVVPGVIAVAVFLFMNAWAEFFFARTLLGTQSNQWVMTIGLTAFEDDGFVNKAGLMAAVSVYVVPPVLLFLVARRHLIKGLTSGGVKG